MSVGREIILQSAKEPEYTEESAKYPSEEAC